MWDGEYIVPATRRCYDPAVQRTVVTPNVATRPGRFRAWQVAFVLVLGVLAGAAILLQIRGWSAVEGQSGDACASGSAVCPHGVVPVLVISFVVGLAAIPFLIWAVARWPKFNI